MRRVLAFSLVIFGSSAAAQDLPALFSVTGVAADDQLNIRSGPSAAAQVIGAFAPDATGIEVVEREGGWGLVNFDERSGYVSLKFLAAEPGESWGALTRPLTCFGTEPFWSFRFDPAAGAVTLDRFEGGPQAMPITARWPSHPWPSAAAIGLEGGTAVLRAGQCSDGMSDFTYGIGFDLFLSGPDGERLSGCCSLARN